MSVSIEILKRKGATKVSLIPHEVVELLDKGLLESVNLIEWLAIDHSILINSVLPQRYVEMCQKSLTQLKKRTAMQSILTVGQSLYLQNAHNDKELFDLLSTHLSDSVRCWAAYLVGLDEILCIKEKLEKIKLFAADTHFGVREIAWMSVRGDIISNLEEAVSILVDWTLDEDPNVRRFASEATRPRGVWCKHIDELKTNPAIANVLLDNLKLDKNKYVKDSVGNWLNDASKTQPQFVADLCDRWVNESDSKDTAYIIKKALRSIE